MFTGIIQAVGSILAIEEVDGDRRVQIDVNGLGLAETGKGDSIAVNGVCLTVVEFNSNSFCADVSAETMQCTTFATLTAGQSVNLEKSLTPQTSLGGHLVSGHVDGVGEVVKIVEDARSIRFYINAPEDIARFIAQKGSICVDGASLTVNNVDGCVFDVNIIPHTLSNTVFQDYSIGTQVNLEVDVIARYVERLSQFSAQ